MQQAEDNKRQPFLSPVKQNRMANIMHSDRMKQSLQYNDNDVSYGVVSQKTHTDKNLLFSNGALTKEVWRPKVTLQWNEPYRTPLTLQ